MFRKASKYVVTYAVDHLDPNPTTKTFDTFDEAHDWLAEEMERRVQFAVDHSPYRVSEKDRDQMLEGEASLARLEERTEFQLLD